MEGAGVVAPARAFAFGAATNIVSEIVDESVSSLLTGDWIGDSERARTSTAR